MKRSIQQLGNMVNASIRTLGGAGSGNFGHGGRPGEVGGSGAGFGDMKGKKFDPGREYDPTTGYSKADSMADNPPIPTPKPILDVIARWGFMETAKEPSAGNGPRDQWRDANGAKISINPRMARGTFWVYESADGKVFKNGDGAHELADYLLSKGSEGYRWRDYTMNHQRSIADLNKIVERQHPDGGRLGQR